MADIPAKLPGSWFTFKVDLNTVVLTLLLAATMWGAGQFMDLRDNITELKASLPLRFEAIEARVSHLENYK